MSMRGRLTTKGRLLTGWWWGFVLTVFLASAPLLADQDKDLLDLESGALALSATTQFGGRWNVQSLLSGSNTEWLKYHWMEQLQRSPLSK
jgi:hypothetical protein